MTEHWLEEAVAACRLPSPPAFPRDLAGEIALSLPVAPVRLAHLTSDKMRDWLEQRGLRVTVPAAVSRPLHGCLVAQAGHGFIFVDSEDDECEQRFTLAHEVAHFVLDHLLPRSQALRAFGEVVRPVLDGIRAPTPEETLYSVLDRIPIGVQVQLMARDPSGSICAGKVAEAEQRADHLALELLAPATLALSLLEETPGESAQAQVALRFGLPAGVARAYTQRLLARKAPSHLTVLALLGEDQR